jgi:DNA-binding transcriptional LysR family regulator
MDWDKLRTFHAVAEAGSFTHAGELLGLSQSAVSRQISGLEDSLGASLFHRHARGLLLTEQGELLFNTTQDVLAKISTAEAMLTDSKEKPRGEFVLTTTVALGTVWLVPRLEEFARLYPDIHVSLRVDDRDLDLSMREADVAIRFHPPEQPNLIQRKLFRVEYHVYASPEYIREFGAPQTVNDLDKHHIITYGDGTPHYIRDVNWLAQVGRPGKKPRHSSLRINNIYGVRRAVEAGMGIAAIPDYIVEDQSKLVRVLPELKAPSFDTYFVYPEELRASKRVSVFRDFLLQKAREFGYSPQKTGKSTSHAENA